MDLPHPALDQPLQAEAAAEDRRSHLRADGTLVIDILVDPPCGEASAREIVVCAPAEVVQRYDAPDPAQREPAKAELQLSEKAKIGVHAQPGREGAVEALVTLTVRF